MNLLGNPLGLVSDAADAVELVTDLLAQDDEQDQRRRSVSPTAMLVGVVVLATLLFLLMSYLTSGPAAPGAAASAAGTRDERTLAEAHAAHFADCAAARAARAAPLIASQRAYRRGLDDDGDGVACEDGETGAR